ncbi:MAG: glycosyltransferase family 61 protein [Granulosicoccus sp.]|nr:glycosyltransferase family 61 protein [Granulosicoccus sp.]
MSAPAYTISPDLEQHQPLEEVLAHLQAHKDEGRLPSSTLVQQCLDAQPEEPNPHLNYAAVGELLVEFEEWEAAEDMAIKALKALPRFGAAFKLLGKSLAGAGRPDEAAICHRYGLPPAMLQKHFNDVPVKWVQSDQSVAESMIKKVAFPSENWTVDPPRQLRERVITEFEQTSLTSKEAYTTILQQGRLWFDGFNTVAWDRYGNIVRDLYRGYAEVVQGSLGDKKPLELEGRVCLLGNRNAVNYYHWMNDVLPRLEVLRASGESLDAIDYYICNPIQHDFQRQTLTKLGIDEKRLINMNDAQYLTADELLMPVYGSNSLGKSQAAWNPAFYKREYLQSSTAPERDLKLYISRGSKGARGVINDEEVIENLLERGFTIVRAENLTVEEQASMFARAKVVLGPHGAGFSNIVFCQPGTKIIELFNAHIVPCFHVISEQTGLEHYIHFCDVYDEDSRPTDNEKYHRTSDARRVSPFRVEPADIDDILAFAEV